MVRSSWRADGWFAALASPHVLSKLMDVPDIPAKAKLVGSLAKNLVKRPGHELWPHSREWVRPVHRT
jgi:hypothetical protein